jgi:hypothetical protein
MSVPGIARLLLFRAAREANASFALFDDKNADLHQLFKKNIVGGASIIYHRHHQAGVSKIRGGPHTCQKILGLDANALYLSCIAQGTYFCIANTLFHTMFHVSFFIQCFMFHFSYNVSCFIFHFQTNQWDHT